MYQVCIDHNPPPPPPPPPSRCSANKTGLVCSPCSEAVLGLSPETSYNCSVVALNDHGQSLPAVEVARTPTRDGESLVAAVRVCTYNYICT